MVQLKGFMEVLKCAPKSSDIFLQELGKKQIPLKSQNLSFVVGNLQFIEVILKDAWLVFTSI